MDVYAMMALAGVCTFILLGLVCVCGYCVERWKVQDKKDFQSIKIAQQQADVKRAERLQDAAHSHSTALSSIASVQIYPSDSEEEKRRKIKGMFDFYDIDGDGDITMSEMRTCFRSIGQSDADADRLMIDFNSDLNSAINFDEFFKMMMILIAAKDANQPAPEAPPHLVDSMEYQP